MADQTLADPGPGPGDGIEAGAGLTVAVDAMGGDYAPAAIVAGAVAAYRESGIQIILAGQPGPLSRDLAMRMPPGRPCGTPRIPTGSRRSPSIRGRNVVV